MTFNKRTVYEMTVDQMAFDELTVDEMMYLRYKCAQALANVTNCSLNMMPQFGASLTDSSRHLLMTQITY
jgi:hypothetical protein